MNPLQPFQHLRDLIHSSQTKKLINSLRGKQLTIRSDGVRNTCAANFVTNLVKYFGDLEACVPKKEYDGSMDLLCQLHGGEYALVEIQVVPQDFWDQRALFYASKVFSSQLKVGGDWKDLKRVIGVNILGGGKDGYRHWKKTQDFSRHYKFQEQNSGCCIENGIEIFQYSIMNYCPEDKDKSMKDWTQYFKQAHVPCQKMMLRNKFLLMRSS
jgi:hypothetical protein